MRLAVLDLGKFLDRFVLQELFTVHARVVLVDAIAPLRCRESLESRHAEGRWLVGDFIGSKPSPNRL